MIGFFAQNAKSKNASAGSAQALGDSTRTEMSSWNWEADNPCSVASVPLTMAHHPLIRCIWQNVWSRKREVLMPFYRFSLQVCHSEYCYRLPVLKHRNDGSEWKKRYKKGHKCLRDEVPFMEIESGKARVAISPVEKQWRRGASIVSE